MMRWLRHAIDRRSVLFGGVAAAGASLASLAGGEAAQGQPSSAHRPPHAGHGGMTTVGEVDHPRNGFDPHAILTDWATGSVSPLPDGRRSEEYTSELQSLMRNSY